MSRLQNPAVTSGMAGSMNQNSGAVKLPFAAPTIWWLNGKPALNTDEIKDARRFGGWGISKEEIDDLRSVLPELPKNWRLFDALPKADGSGTYAAYLCRKVFVAPIARRFAWLDFNGSTKSHTNILGYLAIVGEDKKLTPWGPIILSANSYSGKSLDDAFSNFKKLTSELRGDDLVNFFYHPVGTMGDAPKFETRTSKKPGAKSSSVTPCQLEIPEGGFKDAHLNTFFVGDEIAAEINNLFTQAKEWLDDWNKKKSDKQAEAPPDTDEPGYMNDEAPIY